MILPQLASGQTAPPIIIEAYKYHYNPEIRAFINDCREQSCVLGSKVSYILNPPQANPDFEQYRELHNDIRADLEKRAVESGMTVVMDEPQQERNETGTIFSSFREVRLADGRQIFSKTSVIYTELVTITLISTSPDRAAIESNARGFIFGLVSWSKVHLKRDQ